MTITDLDQLEHEHPALLAMHQRMKQEAETLRARVTELEEYLDAAMRNGMTTERARLKLATKLVELGEERDAWKARTREYVREYMEQDPDLRARIHAPSKAARGAHSVRRVDVAPAVPRVFCPCCNGRIEVDERRQDQVRRR